MTELRRRPQNRSAITGLPRFTERADHEKLHSPSDFGCEPVIPSLFVRQWLSQAAARLRLRPAEIRVLDVGCGRGDTVFWLLGQCWDAWGFDIDSRYVQVGQEYLRATGRRPDRLRTLDAGVTTFPDGWFDIVISDQVFEHVASLGSLIQEISRISKPGALGLHIFPARWRLMEPHLGMPFVHWLPKGPLRRFLLGALLSANIGVGHFKDRPVAERVQIFASFSDEETFYRAPSCISRAMLDEGLSADAVTPSRAKVAHHAPWLPAISEPLAAWLYRNAFSVCLETVRLPSGELQRAS